MSGALSNYILSQWVLCSLSEPEKENVRNTNLHRNLLTCTHVRTHTQHYTLLHVEDLARYGKFRPGNCPRVRTKPCSALPTSLF